MTAYVILMAIDDVDPDQPAAGPSYLPLPGTVEAANDVAAIKLKAKQDQVDLSNGAVAIPARSWRPRQREVKRVERELWT